MNNENLSLLSLYPPFVSIFLLYMQTLLTALGIAAVLHIHNIRAFYSEYAPIVATMVGHVKEVKWGAQVANTG